MRAISRRGSIGLPETTSAYPDWNSDEEKSQVLQTLQQARAVYERLE